MFHSETGKELTCAPRGSLHRWSLGHFVSNSRLKLSPPMSQSKIMLLERLFLTYRDSLATSSIRQNYTIIFHFILFIIFIFCSYFLQPFFSNSRAYYIV